jgi:hypothetical protein
MKKINLKVVIATTAFMMVMGVTFGQDVCYYYQEEKICYEVSATRFLIKSETLDITGIENALQNPVAGSLKNVYDLGDHVFVIEMEHTSKDDMWALQRQLRLREDVIYTSPLFGDYPGTGYTNELSVRLKSAGDYPVLEEYANAYHIENISTREYLPGVYILTLPHNPEKDAIQTALELYETGLFLDAYPNLITLCPFDWCPFGPESNMNTVVKEERTVVYPNPVSDILYVNLENNASGSCDIRLYNSLGNMCRQAKATGGMVELSVSNLPGGIYFLNICNSSASKPESHKIIVKH